MYYISITNDKISTIKPIDIGRKFFHVRYIRWSYRIRGRVARTHTNNIAKNIVLIINIDVLIIAGPITPKNKIADVSLINKIFVYSAIKIKANNPLLYSVLNPDTSSDSPSAKSNGVRLVSARVVVNHISIRGIDIKITHDFCVEEIIVQSILWSINKHEIKIRAILTSYEIVCATPRSLPNSAYLELEHHPAVNVGYTFILDTHKKYRMPNCIYID